MITPVQHVAASDDVLDCRRVAAAAVAAAVAVAVAVLGTWKWSKLDVVICCRTVLPGCRGGLV